MNPWYSIFLGRIYFFFSLKYIIVEICNFKIWKVMIVEDISATCLGSVFMTIFNIISALSNGQFNK